MHSTTRPPMPLPLLPLFLGLGLLTALCACSKKETPSSAPPPAGSAPAADKAAQPAPAARPGPGAASWKIDCDKLVSQALRDKYFPGTTMKQGPMCPGCPEQCEFVGKDLKPSVMADCRGGDSPGWLEQVSAMWDKQKSMRKASGLGRAAYQTGDMQIVWVPEKHNCYITITWIGGKEKLLELAKAIDANLTPAAIGK